MRISYLSSDVCSSYLLAFASALVLPATLSAQVIARLTVEKESQPRNNVPVSVSLDEITFQADSTLKFTEVTSSGNVPVDFQIEHSKHGRFIWWLLQGNTPAGKERVFELEIGRASCRERLGTHG